MSAALSSTGATPCPSDGLVHLGLLYDTPEDLVETVGPHVQEALRRGDAVLTLVDRRTARELRDTLGAVADAVTFGTPSDLRGPRPENFLRRLRNVAPSGGRGLVLTQYATSGLVGEDLAVGENGINLVLADQPLTMLCACASTADPTLRETVRDSHPRLVRSADVEDNPGFRLPADRCPTPTATWGGSHALRALFSGTGDLAGIRARITSLASAAGLSGDDVHAAVFAVHEAVVLACDDAERARADRGSTAPCALDVWVAPDRLVVEVRGPRPVPEADGGPEPGAPRNPYRVAGPLRYVRLFCRDVTDISEGDTRTIRVVTGPP